MMEHEFSRTEMLIGKAALDKLKASKVAVFGVGGVGSFVVEGLVRSGIGHFVLVDHAKVTLTNLNRQIIATQSTIGQAKVAVALRRILDINPLADVEIHEVFYTPELAGDLLRADLDYIVDAIDTVSAKIDLICRAKALGIPIISAMGAGNKLDPTRFQVTDIYKTTTCPLSRVVRRELKKRGITSLKVVYSPEQPLRPALDSDAPEEPPKEPLKEQTAAKDKRRAPGSVAFVPSVAGLIIAGEVVKDLIAATIGSAALPEPKPEGGQT
jgi:tRNA threonylcarbamoyladenosine dehydratase